MKLGLLPWAIGFLPLPGRSFNLLVKLDSLLLKNGSENRLSVKFWDSCSYLLSWLDVCFFKRWFYMFLVFPGFHGFYGFHRFYRSFCSTDDRPSVDAMYYLLCHIEYKYHSIRFDYIIISIIDIRSYSILKELVFLLRPSSKNFSGWIFLRFHNTGELKFC